MKTNYNSCKINVERKTRSIQDKLGLILTKLGLFNIKRIFVFEEYSPLEANQVLRQFCGELRKVGVSEYEHDSLRVM